MEGKFFEVWQLCTKSHWSDCLERLNDAFAAGVLHKQLDSNEYGDYLSVYASVDGGEYFPCLLEVTGKGDYVDAAYFCNYDNCVHFINVARLLTQYDEAGELD